MKIRLICIGKTSSNYLLEGEKEYLKRLSHYCKVEKVEIPDIKKSNKLSQNDLKDLEGKEFLKQINPNERVILLDEKGKSYDSTKFSKQLQQIMNQGGKGICFLVGGAYGFSDEIYAKSEDKIRLSEMTFSHQMVRLFFLEQLYRGFTILKGEPYHHN